MARIARAQWRPLPQNDSSPHITPRVIIVHTMVGNAGGTESWFRNPGAGGVESTFGIGGPWEGPDVDGDIYQWMDTNRQADCNLAANGISVSIETADGGNPSNPFSAKQIAALVALIADLCRVHKIPPTLVTTWDGTGLGYHQQFPRWNTDHNCPGSVRRAQLLNEVFPAVARAMAIPTSEENDLKNDERSWLQNIYNAILVGGPSMDDGKQSIDRSIGQIHSELRTLAAAVADLAAKVAAK